MYIRYDTMPRLALCIISIILFIGLANSQASNSTQCYNALNNGALGTTFYVEEDTPYGSPYACSLSLDNVAFASGTYTFTAGVSGGTTTCGEMLSIPEISFGYYECEMQPPGIAGTITSCMVESSVKTDYESVYIKFIGNDTQNVYIGYYAKGVGYPAGPYAFPKSFDVSAESHRYAFEWTSGYIKWYFDGAEISAATGANPLPLTPNRLYVNLLIEEAGVATDDSGIYTNPSVNRVFSTVDNGTVNAVFTNISYTPAIYISCDGTGIIPGNSGWAAYDPNACDLRTPFIIYSDSLAKGWTSTDSSQSNFTGSYLSVPPVYPHTGQAGIGWYFTAAPQTALLYFLSPNTFNSTDYETFEFWISGGTNGQYNGQQVGIAMLFDDSGDYSLTVNIAQVLVGGVQANQWSRVVVPFTLFGLSPNITQQVKGFRLSSLSESYGGYMFVDDVQLGFENPMCSNKTVVLYDDKPENGFSSATSYGTYVISSTSFAHTGTSSIQIEMFGATDTKVFLVGKTQYSSKQYQGVSFWIDTSLLQGWKWTIGIISATSTLADAVAGAGPLDVYNYYGGNIPQQVNQWSHIVIPFSEFGIAQTEPLIGILFQALLSEDASNQGTLYVDDISFIEEIQPGDTAAHNGASALTAGLLGAMVLAASLLL